MPDVALFTVRPPLRCFGRSGILAETLCGKPASWMIPTGNGLDPRFFCDDCRPPNAQPVHDAAPFRRVTVQLEIFLAGATYPPSSAHWEAVELVMRAIEAVGGVGNLRDVTSAIGRCEPPRPTGRARMARAGLD